MMNAWLHEVQGKGYMPSFGQQGVVMRASCKTTSWQCSTLTQVKSWKVEINVLLNAFCLLFCGGGGDRAGRHVVKHFMELQSQSVQNSMRDCSTGVTKNTYYWPLNHPLKIHWKSSENPPIQRVTKNSGFSVDFQWIFSGRLSPSETKTLKHLYLKICKYGSTRVVPM